MPLAKFVDPLPIPHVLQPKRRDQVGTYYEIRMTQFQQKLHRDLPPTTLWGYEGTYPGPTIEVQQEEQVRVKWINDLPDKHLLPVDRTIHGAEPDVPEVRTVVHVHGGVMEEHSDGYPEAWFTNGFSQVGPAFARTVYEYANPQRAATLWYHDHTVGITRLNVYAGLSGFYLIRSRWEDGLNLPKGAFEIPLMIQDRSFNPDGSLFYPRQPRKPVPGVDPSIVPEFVGDHILVNGKVWPYLEVEPRKYRFRLANGSNARFYRLHLSSEQSFYQLGAEGGLFEFPVEMRELLLAPAERADVIVDFSDRAGQIITMTNDSPIPFPNGPGVDPETTGQVMQFRVTRPLSAPDKNQIPSRLEPVALLREEEAVRVRYHWLNEHTDRYGRPLLLLNGRRWSEPITEEPSLGSVEIWNLINWTPDTHPIHLHLVHFQVLDRQPFDVQHFKTTGEFRFLGPLLLPDANERGWKDTVRANPGQITRIIARFSPYAGTYPWHCHVLEHEENEMMRPYRVHV